MDLTRRQFLNVSASTSALVMTISLPNTLLAKATHQADGSDGSDGSDDNIGSVYLRIFPDNNIEISSPVMDMGQHMKTTAPMMLAEELDADWSLVSCIAAKTYLKKVANGVDHKYVEESSGGSHATRNTIAYMRNAGATARQMLRQAAAEKWHCDIDDVSTKAGYLYQTSTNNKLSYGDVALFASKLPLPKSTPKLKKPSEFSIMGTDIKTVDIDQIITGAPLYGQDMEIEGMLHAVVERCPHFQGKVKSFNAKAALKVKGVRKVFEIEELRTEDGKRPFTYSGVAVVADNLWAAIKARRTLVIEWDKGPWKDESSDAMLKSYFKMAQSNDKGRVMYENGDIEEGFKSTTKTYEQQYSTPFLAHACMEPFNVIADIRKNSATVISGHQNPAGIANAVAETTKLDPLSVEVISPRSGGGFGRRYSTDFIREAALISKQLNNAVKVTWSREDEIAHDYFAPATAASIKAGIDANGKITSWHHKEARKEGGIYAQCFPANIISNYRAEVFNKEAGVPLGPWRGPGHLQFSFAAESMIDEIIHDLKRDPLEYRLELLGEPRDFKYTSYGADKISTGRMAECYKAAAKLANWDKPRPKGVGLGLSGHFTFGSYCAFVVEVDSRIKGKERITQAWGAIDCGMAVNPNHIINQMEGGFIDGLNAAMYNKIDIEEGKVINTNFHTLNWMKMAQAPISIETEIIKNDYPATGVGEPPTAPAASALANAIFAATGNRLRSLPLSLEA